MTRVRTLVVVLAGGAGGRLELLTRDRAKPAVPFAGTHRLIDFPLSNCHNAGLSDVWVAQQFNPVSLSDHLANGRPWDLDRTDGGLLILHPRQGHDDRERLPAGHGRRAVAQRAADPRVRARGARRRSAPTPSTRSTTARSSSEHVEAGARRDDGHHRGRPGRRRPLRRRPGRTAGACATTSTSPTTRRATSSANEVFVFAPGPLLDLLDELAGERRRRSSRTSATRCCRGSSTPAARASTASTATGATSARSTPTGRPTWSCSPSRRRSTSTIPAGRSSPGDRAPRVGARAAAARRSPAGCSRPARTVGGRVERSVIGRGARVEAGAVGARLGAAAGRRRALRGDGSSARSSTTASRWARARGSARATATSRWSGSPSGSPPAPRCRPAGACPARTDTLRTWSPRRSTTRSPTTTT